MIRTNSMLFQAEMENLDLGLGLGSSDLLFADDLFNIPIDQCGTTNDTDFGKDDLASTITIATNTTTTTTNNNTKKDDDLLERIIREVKLPHEVDDDSSVEVKPEPMDDFSDVAAWESLAEQSMLFDDMDSQQQNIAELSPDNGSSCYASSAYQLSPSSSCGSFVGPEDTQALIDDVEDFLVDHEVRAVPKAVATAKAVTKAIKSEDDDTAKAEQLLNALMTGNINMDDSGFASANSSFGAINNISEITTDDGQKIVVIITNDDVSEASNSPVFPALDRSTPSPAPSDASSAYRDNSSDSDWSPNSPVLPAAATNKRTVVGRKRKAAAEMPERRKERGPYKRTKTYYNVKDKKERKKLQNVVAARRYRDKKKSEMNGVEGEVEALTKRNVELNNKLDEMKGEYKTLKKLMKELGLVK